MKVNSVRASARERPATKKKSPRERGDSPRAAACGAPHGVGVARQMMLADDQTTAKPLCVEATFIFRELSQSRIALGNSQRYHSFLTWPADIPHQQWGSTLRLVLTGTGLLSFKQSPMAGRVPFPGIESHPRGYQVKQGRRALSKSGFLLMARG